MEKVSESVSKNDDTIKNEANGSAPQDLSVVIQTVLQTTQDRFQMLSDQILHRIDEMSKRLDDLEKNIVDLMNQAGVEGEP